MPPLPAAPAANGTLVSSTNSKGKEPEEPRPKPVNNWRSTRNQKQSYYKAPYSKTSWLKNNTGKCVHTIAPGTVQPCSSDVSSEDGFVVLCSYNWQLPEQRRGAKEQVICVPGTYFQLIGNIKLSADVIQVPRRNGLHYQLVLHFKKTPAPSL
jgi:hypothetical protein